MTPAEPADGPGYDESYAEFDAPLMRRIRQEAYGRDIGQHSWVGVEELEVVVPQLGLTRSSRLLDLGCGPGGPLTFVVGRVGCRGMGLDRSKAAITIGQARARSLGLENLVTLGVGNLDEPLVFENGTFDAAVSFDVILHLRDRDALFREVHRVLAPGGRFLFTDAGVLVGTMSDEEKRLRSIYGPVALVPPGFNEERLEAVGFRLVARAEGTAGLLKNASGRLAARLAHRAELEQREGASRFASQQRYLETVIALADRGALSRIIYLAERQQ